MPKRPLPKPVRRVLERCFEVEVAGNLPAKFPHASNWTINGIRVSAPVARAWNEGLIEQVDRKMAVADGLPPMVIRGFALTERGRRHVLGDATE